MTLTSIRNALWQQGLAIGALRWLVGFGFAAHGYAKLDRGVSIFADTVHAMGIGAMGVNAPLILAWLVVLLELVGGLLLMAGALVAPVCVPLAIVVLTALFGVHVQYGFSSVRLRAITSAGPQFGPVGYEISLLYLAALFVLFVAPPDPLSLESWLGKRRRAEPTSQGAVVRDANRASTL